MRYTISLLIAVALLSACSDDESPVKPQQTAASMAFVRVPAGLDPYTGHALAAFEIGRFEVLQIEWEAVMRIKPWYFVGDSLPAHNLSWYQAQDFIDSLNARDNVWQYRLPTYGEWTHACAAGTTTDFYTGNRTVTGCTDIDPALDRAGWYCANSGNKLHPCGRKEPNAYGLYDMHGNVPEWCMEEFDEKRHYVKGGGYATDGEQAQTFMLGAMISSCGYDGAQPYGFRLVRERR